MPSPENTALKEAVEDHNVNLTRKLLSEGVDPNYLIKSQTRLIRTPMTKKDIDILKLLVDHKLYIQRGWLKTMFDELGSGVHAKDMVEYILNHYDKRPEVFHVIFDGLATSKQESTDTLEFLIDEGLPINELYGYEGLVFEDAVAPLHHCIAEAKYDFMTVLIQRGVDIEKKTGRARHTPLLYAIEYNDANAAEILLKNGASMTDLSWATQEPALHIACAKHNFDIAQLMIEYGVDVNILDLCGNSALTQSPSDGKTVLMREIAKLKFEGREICRDSLNYLKSSKSDMAYFEGCLDELKKMKECTVFNDLTLYDILQLQKDRKKLIPLLKNDDFIAAYKTCKDHVSKTIKVYENDLNDLFEKAFKEEDALKANE